MTIAQFIRKCWISLALPCQIAVLCPIALTVAVTSVCSADDLPRFEGKAPANHELLKHTLGGAYFVAKPLKQEYDQLLAQVKTLKAEIDDGRIDGSEAVRQAGELQAKLDQLRKEIEQKKVLVSAVKAFTRTETTTFDLGPERLLVITADAIRVEHWDGPQVKCVLEKTILGGPDAATDEAFGEMGVVHRHGVAPNVVGHSPEEWEADERKFLASPEGKALSDEQRANRAKLVHRIMAGWSMFRDFQGKEIDTLEITGLTHEQGNRQILLELTSEGEGGSLGSEWQRHASLTVYVPPSCERVALRGCLVGLDVRGLQASLLVSSSGSRDRNYDGTFEIRDLHGSLTIDNAPIQLIENVEGDVRIFSTTELANTGTMHESGLRTHYTPPPMRCVCKNIAGDFSAWFSRSELELEAIGGTVDVKNEFGDTRLRVAQRLPEAAHRVVSESGRVEVHLGDGIEMEVPLAAVTNSGTVRTNLPQSQFDDRSFTTGSSHDGSRRNWHGITSKREPDAMLDPAAFERPALALEGANRSPGLDLISRNGMVLVLQAP